MNNATNALHEVLGLVESAKLPARELGSADVLVLCKCGPQEQADAAVVAAVNFIREHGPALLAGEEDGARYRWLRDHVCGDIELIEGGEMSVIFPPDGDFEWGASLDKALDMCISESSDAARQAQPESTQQEPQS